MRMAHDGNSRQGFSLALERHWGRGREGDGEACGSAMLKGVFELPVRGVQRLWAAVLIDNAGRLGSVRVRSGPGKSPGQTQRVMTAGGAAGAGLFHQV